MRFSCSFRKKLSTDCFHNSCFQIWSDLSFSAGRRVELSLVVSQLPRGFQWFVRPPFLGLPGWEHSASQQLWTRTSVSTSLKENISKTVWWTQIPDSSGIPSKSWHGQIPLTDPMCGTPGYWWSDGKQPRRQTYAGLEDSVTGRFHLPSNLEDSMEGTDGWILWKIHDMNTRLGDGFRMFQIFSCSTFTWDDWTYWLIFFKRVETTNQKGKIDVQPPLKTGSRRNPAEMQDIDL